MTTSDAPILILGMHRSGTSCLTAMLRAAGGTVTGNSLRNWDNPRGHHEAADLVRLNEDVLATSGGHWLSPPKTVVWTKEQADRRDALLAVRPGHGPAIWKDPRTLLTLPFWMATTMPVRRVGVVRHPLAVARSLLAWRQTPIDEGFRLWEAHVQALVDAARAQSFPVLGFDRPRAAFIETVVETAVALGLTADPAAVGEAYAAELVHHDGGRGPEGDPALRARCEALYAEAVALSGKTMDLSGTAIAGTGGFGRPFPWDDVQAATAALRDSDVERAEMVARSALSGFRDPGSVLAPLAAAFLRHRAAEALLRLVDSVELTVPIAGLLRGKALLALRRPAEAAAALRRACDGPETLYEARHLLPVALWDSSDPAGADAELAALLPDALYPFRVHARRAEWAWNLGRVEAAMAYIDAALDAAPPWRQGRLLYRRAAWKDRLGDVAGAEEDRRIADERDPGYRGGKSGDAGE